MSKSKKSFALLLLSCLALAGCSSEHKTYPVDYDDARYDLSPANGEKHDDLVSNVVGNKKIEYYENVASTSTIYEKTLNEILLQVSKVAHDYTAEHVGSDVTKIKNDTFEGSVADDFGSIATTFDNLETRAKDSMVSSVKGGSYTKDNLYYENKYAQYLDENYYYLDVDKSKATKNVLITPERKYDDLFSADRENTYKTYREKEVYSDRKINYLVSEYIYSKSYASIGNSNARNVQIVALTDRSDEPGAAKKLLDAYVADYVQGDKAGQDKDFSVLSRLWKGITKSIANNSELDDEGRYSSAVVLTDEEEAWLRSKGILPSSSTQDDSYSSTLTGKVLSDWKQVKEGQENFNKLDSSLESTYTGTYAYDVETGVRKAIDDIATKDFVTKGWYLSSSGISSLPSALSSRIFSPRLTSSKKNIEDRKKSENVGKYTTDFTIYEKDGFRYLTVADTPSTDSSNIIYYDSSTKTYYLTRILDVIDTSALSKGNNDSIYDTEEKKEQVAREVAYSMSTTGSYKTNGIVYWLSRLDINYKDEGFRDYLKSNYNDVFKTDNPYSSEPKIKIGE